MSTEVIIIDYIENENYLLLERRLYRELSKSLNDDNHP